MNIPAVTLHALTNRGNGDGTSLPLPFAITFLALLPSFALFYRLSISLDTSLPSPYTTQRGRSKRSQTCGVVPKLAAHPPPGALPYKSTRIQAHL